jgi:hypothetical protein
MEKASDVPSGCGRKSERRSGWKRIKRLAVGRKMAQISNVPHDLEIFKIRALLFCPPGEKTGDVE